MYTAESAELASDPFTLFCFLAVPRFVQVCVCEYTLTWVHSIERRCPCALHWCLHVKNHTVYGAKSKVTPSDGSALWTWIRRSAISPSTKHTRGFQMEARWMCPRIKENHCGAEMMTANVSELEQMKSLWGSHPEGWHPLYEGFPPRPYTAQKTKSPDHELNMTSFGRTN